MQVIDQNAYIIWLLQLQNLDITSGQLHGRVHGIYLPHECHRLAQRTPCVLTNDVDHLFFMHLTQPIHNHSMGATRILCLALKI